MPKNNFAPALLVVATLMAGCSGQAGTAAPASPASSTGLRFGAPPVPAPLDPTPLETDPCAVMTPVQVASLGAPFKNTAPDPNDPTGPSCGWRFATNDGPSSVSGGVFTGDPTHGGISGLYGQQQIGGLTKFQPFTVNGYPGVVYDAATNTAPGGCAAAIGLRNDLTYTISVSLDALDHPFADGCELGKKVAGFVIRYLQNGGH
jgi:uncharacterized protein DUF3558